MHSLLGQGVVSVAILVALVSYSGIVPAAEPGSIKILPGSAIANSGIKLEASEIPRKAGWQALVCGPSSCELKPVRVSNNKAAGLVRAVPYPVQRLTRNKPNEITIALLTGLPATDKPIATYFSTSTPRTSLDASSGSMGTAFNIPNTGLCRILPRWNNVGADTFMTLYLEQGAQRQSVGIIPLEVLNQEFSTKSILLWAGDIDGDRKLDLITRNSAGSYSLPNKGGDIALGTGIHLWLSTNAPPGHLVRLAASLENWEDVVEDNL